MIGTKQTTDEHDILRRMSDLQVRVFGRLPYGDGTIDGGDVTKEQFKGSLEFLAKDGLVSIRELNTALLRSGAKPINSLLELPGNCMDGRGNKLTKAGREIPYGRPKIMGGPTLFLTLATGIVTPRDETLRPLIDTFSDVASAMPMAAAMHIACGAAGVGGAPVLEKLIANFDDIYATMEEITEGGIYLSDNQKDTIKFGLDRTAIAGRAQFTAGDFTEAAMVDTVKARSQYRSDAVVELQVDHDHPNHSHDEKGITFLMSQYQFVMRKDLVNNEGFPNMFYSNTTYGFSLVDNWFGRRNAEQLQLARALTFMLPLAANAVLGRNQFVGTLGKYSDLETFYKAA